MSTSSSSSAKRRRNTTNVKGKLDKYFAAGKFYEAQQLYQTLFNRYALRKQYAAAIDLLQDGIHKLLQNQQGNAAGELGLKLVECYEKEERKLDDGTRQLLLKLFPMFPDNSLHAKHKFIAACIKWSKKGDKNGDKALNHAMALSMSQAREWADAQRYWIRAETPIEHAADLVAWAHSGYKGERDLFIARAVLQYLCLENIRDANIVLEKYLAAFTDEPLDTPLIHFLKFLLQTVERDAAPLFEVLKEKYALSLARDPALAEYLNKIGNVFFDIPMPQGMLDSLLSMFQQ